MRHGRGSELPVADRAMLSRQRLLDQLRARWFVPVTVLTAPAGYGKTTLLSQAIAANAVAPLGIDCWLPCGPDLAAASSLGEALCQAVEVPASPGVWASRGDNLAAVARAVGEALWRRSPQQVALVLDDVHEIVPDSDGARLLAAVVTALPSNGHLVLAGRQPPPVPLARLDVEGRVVRLDQADLAFTEGEVAAFAALRGVPGARLRACGGWPALAELFASGRGSGGETDTAPVAETSAPPDTATDYVAEEVLAQLAPERRRALALLAHVGPFDSDLARAVLADVPLHADAEVAGRGADADADGAGPGLDVDVDGPGRGADVDGPGRGADAQVAGRGADVDAEGAGRGADVDAEGAGRGAVAGGARRGADGNVDVAELLSGIPLAMVVAEGQWSLHALWQSLLAGEVSAADVAEARRRAAAVLLHRGQAGAAVRHLIDAAAWDELAEAVVELLGAGAPPVPHDVLAGWYDRLPVDVRRTPSGRLLAAVVAAELDPQGSWERFEECAAEFRTVGHDQGELACLVQLGKLAWWTDEPELLTKLALRVLQLEAAGCAEATPLACLGRAMFHDIQNDSRQILAELDRIPPGSLSDMWQGLVSWLRAMALLQLGYAHEALEVVDHALAYTGPMHAPLAEGTRMQAWWALGRTAEAFEAMPDLLRRVREAGYRNHTALAAAQWSAGLALHGDLEGAVRSLAQARAAAVSRDAPLIDSNLAVAEAALAVAQGDEASAAEVLADYLTRFSLGQGLSAAPQRRWLSLFYVLLPETRAWWDQADLGPAYLAARDLARAVAAVRDRGRLPPGTRSLGEVSLVQAHLPLQWIAELGVAAVAAGRDDGWDLLDATWSATRPVVADIAQHGRGPVRAAARQAMGRLAVLPQGRLALRLLGPVELARDGELVDAPDWRRERVRSLLAYLVLHGTVSRGEVGDALWPALDAEAQSRNLRVTLTYLLRVLEPERGARDASFFVRQHGGNVSLHAGDQLTVDVWEFDVECERAREADRRGAPTTVLDHALRALDLWRGEPTELLSEPSAVAAIEPRRLRLAGLAVRAGELLLARGEVDEAHGLAERALAVDPWLEAAHRLVVAIHRARGDELAARRALGRYRAAVDELGVGPDEATLMVERLLDSGLELRPAR